GAIEWQQRGLDLPESVLRARDAYLEDQDDIGQWIRQALEKGPTFKSRSFHYNRSYRDHCKSHGLKPVEQKTLTMTLKQRGYKECRIGTNGDRGLAGFRTREEAQFEWEQRERHEHEIERRIERGEPEAYFDLGNNAGNA